MEKQYKVNRAKQRTIQKKLRIDKAIARSGESSIKFRDTARTIAKKIPGFTKTITTPAVANKAGKIIKPVKTKVALKPIVKKAITLADSEIDLATNRLNSGRGNLTRRAEKIRELSTQKGLAKTK